MYLWKVVDDVLSRNACLDNLLWCLSVAAQAGNLLQEICMWQTLDRFTDIMCDLQGPLLITWFDFNLSMDK